MSPRFHTLTVKSVTEETPEAVSIAFDLPENLANDYAFVPGQYLTLQSEINGEDVRRSYSICSAADDNELKVAVKAVEGGRFSSFATTTLEPGMELQIMTPMGRFVVPDHDGEAKTYIGFAAGSGITPLMSIIKTMLRREPESRFFLFYGNRTSKSIMFKDNLDDLKDQFLGRLSVYHVLSRESQDLSLLSGRLDADKVKTFLNSIIPVSSVNHAFLCGPGDMIEEASATLLEMGLKQEQVHCERFTASDGQISHQSRKKTVPEEVAATSEVDVMLDGARHTLSLKTGETIVEASIRAGLEVPFSCKGGMCCTCRAKVLEGSVEMAANYSLEPWELEAGFVLTCQARPTTNKVVVDYDEF